MFVCFLKRLKMLIWKIIVKHDPTKLNITMSVFVGLHNHFWLNSDLQNEQGTCTRWCTVGWPKSAVVLKTGRVNFNFICNKQHTHLLPQLVSSSQNCQSPSPPLPQGTPQVSITPRSNADSLNPTHNLRRSLQRLRYCIQLRTQKGQIQFLLTTHPL